MVVAPGGPGGREHLRGPADGPADGTSFRGSPGGPGGPVWTLGGTLGQTAPSTVGAAPPTVARQALPGPALRRAVRVARQPGRLAETAAVEVWPAGLAVSAGNRGVRRAGPLTAARGRWAAGGGRGQEPDLRDCKELTTLAT